MYKISKPILINLERLIAISGVLKGVKFVYTFGGFKKAEVTSCGKALLLGVWIKELMRAPHIEI